MAEAAILTHGYQKEELFLSNLKWPNSPVLCSMSLLAPLLGREQTKLPTSKHWKLCLIKAEPLCPEENRDVYHKHFNSIKVWKGLWAGGGGRSSNISCSKHVCEPVNIWQHGSERAWSGLMNICGTDRLTESSFLWLCCLSWLCIINCTNCKSHAWQQRLRV